MTQQEFFESLASGATWSAGVAFKRSNALPLDRYSVFASYTEAQTYLSNAVCYPGQVLAVVENITETVEEQQVITGVKTTVYVVEVDKDGAFGLKEVGTKPIGDEASIEVSADGIVSLFGFDAAQEGYLPQKVNGKIEWVPISAIVEGDGNTTTTGDGKSIVTTGDTEVLVAKLNGFDDATDGQIAYKKDGKLAWKDEFTYDDSELVANIEALEGKVDVEGTVSAAISEAKTEAIEDAVEQAATSAAQLYVAKEGYVEFTQTEKDKLAGLENYDDTAVKGRLDTAESDIDTLEGKVATIEGDYLKAQDKKDIEDAYKAADEAIDERLVKVETFFETAEGESLSEALDTLVEIQKYVGEHGAEADKMVKDIAQNATDIDALEGEVSTIKEDYLKKADYTPYDDTQVKADVQANKTAIETINDAENGILATAKAYTDSEISDVEVKVTENTAEIAAVNKHAEEFATAKADNALQSAKDYSDGKLAAAKEELEGDITEVDNKLVNYAVKADVEGEIERIDANFSNYTTTADLTEQLNAINTEVGKKAAQSDLSALQTKVDGLAGIKSVNTSEFAIDGNGELALVSVSQDKVAGLTTDLANKVTRQFSEVTEGDETKQVEWILLSPENQEKLAALVIGDEGVEISGKVNAENVEGLGAFITTNRNSVEGLLSSDLQAKLQGIQDGAEVNAISGIKLAGAETNLIISNKTVTIPYATANLAGIVKSATGENKVAVAADGTMEVNSLNVNKLVQTEGDTLILNGGSASA